MNHNEILGIHHVTAIAGNPQQNIDFYAGFLGLRLVKLTVNYDDPGTYHLYYGDSIGHPGSIMTFFPWPSGQKGRHGTGQLTTTSFSIPEGSLEYWMQRLEAHKIPYDGPFQRFEENVVSFVDYDGLRLELVVTGFDRRKPWEEGPVPPEKAIRGFYGVTLSEEGYERTAWLLNDKFGFKQSKQENNRFRYEARASEPGGIVDVICSPDAPRGFVSVGTVHHVAWRTQDDEQQKKWRQELIDVGLDVTPIIDRKYFHSIYFLEPGGVLFEIATDPPGFTVDQPSTELGTRLVLPNWLEPMRKKLELALPPLNLPHKNS
jgi:catechol 2,3-dioxygenase-like lactoylglutathione lyase family enzyme